MKNIQKLCAFSPKIAIKLRIPLSLKIKILLLFLAIGLQVSADNVKGQTVLKAISMKNVTLEQVFNKIEDSSNYVFMYNNKTIQSNRIVSVNCKSGRINDILEQLFQGSNISYSINGNQIILALRNKIESNAVAQVTQQRQNILVTGKIVDTKGDPIIGATIAQKNVTSNGAISDINGNFQLRVPRGAMLVISYVGYVTQTVAAVPNKQLAIVLVEDTKML